MPDRRKISEKYRRLQWIKDATDALSDKFDSVDEAERYANALERIKLEESDREGRINSLLIEAACEYVISRALGKYNGE